MALKSIQIRGISHSPSDRGTADGGCVDNINLFIDQDETALAQPAVPTGILGTSVPVSYIHETTAYTNYVGFQGGEIIAFAKTGAAYSEVLHQDLGEAIKQITSMGNTLMAITPDHIHYFQFKDVAYSYLGVKICEPHTRIWADQIDSLVDYEDADHNDYLNTAYITHNDAEGMTEVEEYALLVALTNKEANVPAVDASLWKRYVEKEREAIKDEGKTVCTYGDVVHSIENLVWEKSVALVSHNRSSRYFSRPVFVRTAVKLYNGTYIYQSVPMLLGTGSNAWMTVERMTQGEQIDYGTYMGRIKVKLTEVFRAGMDVWFDSAELTKWRDIISSVDIFMSTDIANPGLGSHLTGAVSTTPSDNGFHFLFGNQEGPDLLRDVKDEILSKGSFFLVESIPVEDLLGGTQTIDLKPMNQDELMVKTALPNDTLSHHESFPLGATTVYNERIIYSGLGQRIYAGYPGVQSCTTIPSSRSHSYRYKAYVRSSSGELATNVTPLVSVNAGAQGAFLYYPDPRCYKIDILVDGSATYSIPMTEHPMLNGAYALSSLDQTVLDLSTASPHFDDTVQPVLRDNTKFVMSASANPFLLPTASRATFSAEVIKVATVTTVISTNRTGPLPLYIFTKDGIWAIQINNAGEPDGLPQSISRDVALSPDSITQIDQAVVFTTSKGVMMLAGSKVSELSQYMTGPDFVPGQDVLDLLAGTRWEEYATLLADRTPFLEFMVEARVIYDYVGSRLIFWNPAHDWQYVYCLKPQTWHRMRRNPGVQIASVLNSYPEAHVCMKVENHYEIYSYDYRPHDSSTTELTGLLVTRGMDFDAPWVNKTITRLRLRSSGGEYAMALMGSDDGKHYALVSSLRGKSWKFYRALVCMAGTTQDRFTSLDLSVDERFMNKIR